jgi:predicted  nucleic acid-binding Zn-ribbon protein
MKEQFKPFNPEDSVYKKVEDLPSAHRAEFIDQEGGGFVRREADERRLEAERQATENINAGKLEGLSPMDVLHNEALAYDKLRTRYLNEFNGVEQELDEEVSTLKLKEDLLKEPSLASDRSFMLGAVKYDGNLLEHASPMLQNDEEVVLTALESSSHSLNFVSERLRHDRDFILRAAEKIEGIFSSIMWADSTNKGLFKNEFIEQLSKDREIVLTAVSKNGYSLKDADSEFCGDKEVVLAAVKNSGFMLEKVSRKLRGDRDVVLAAVTEEGYAISYADPKFRDDKDVIMAAVKKEPGTIFYASERLQADREIAELFLTYAKENKNGELVVPHGFSRDRDLMIETIRRSPDNFSQADEDLRRNKDFVLESLRLGTKKLWAIPEELRSDREVALAAVKNDGLFLEKLPSELRGDREIVAAARESNSEALKFASSSIKRAEKLKGLMQKVKKIFE